MSEELIKVTGPVVHSEENTLSHLRLWNVPFFCRERDARSVILAGLQNGGFVVREVEVTLMRVLKTTKDNKSKVGGNRNQQPHCGGSATVLGRVTFGTDQSIKFLSGKKQLFRSEVSTQPNPRPPDSARRPVQTLFCKLFYCPNSSHFSMTSLLELIQPKLQGSMRLITHLVTMRRPRRDIQIKNVQSTDFMIECSTPEAAAWVRSDIHDSSFTCCEGMNCVRVLTANFTTEGVSTVYKPIFNDDPQQRIENSRSVSSTLQPPPPFVIPPDIQKLAESACSLAISLGNIPQDQMPYVLLGALAFQEQVEGLQNIADGATAQPFEGIQSS
eukprot:TRINITY_DN9344_c0_g1_i3.p1 TRINITY_DN9344_c0_g1~~TRINITY_DN9344_c0_g1_i3.p1  ORF type:complete len:329 (+),score=57.50 TRINITY_DN9344_c0_g1_i3:108-1094(+)